MWPEFFESFFFFLLLFFHDFFCFFDGNELPSRLDEVIVSFPEESSQTDEVGARNPHLRSSLTLTVVQGHNEIFSKFRISSNSIGSIVPLISINLWSHNDVFSHAYHSRIILPVDCERLNVILIEEGEDSCRVPTLNPHQLVVSVNPHQPRCIQVYVDLLGFVDHYVDVADDVGEVG